jgi:hypothetical protein
VLFVSLRDVSRHDAPLAGVGKCNHPRWVAEFERNGRMGSAICSRLQSEKIVVRLQSTAIGRVQVAQPGGAVTLSRRPSDRDVRGNLQTGFQTSEPGGVRKVIN